MLVFNDLALFRASVTIAVVLASVVICVIVFIWDCDKLANCFNASIAWALAFCNTSLSALIASRAKLFTSIALVTAGCFCPLINKLFTNNSLFFFWALATLAFVSSLALAYCGSCKAVSNLLAAIIKLLAAAFKSATAVAKLFKSATLLLESRLCLTPSLYSFTNEHCYLMLFEP
ncbi:hypothetical protein [Mycoplasma sp. 4F]|uniref:hypothetical protein n=1 Tax=Mycoplasma sp. 4F TaxID=3401664 RepID=UPI003AAAEA72